jgi:hypothetical protein
MKYRNGHDIRLGGVVSFDSRYRGTVVASMDTQKYLPGAEHRAYHEQAVMVDSDFGGMVHHTAASTDELILLERRARLTEYVTSREERRSDMGSLRRRGGRLQSAQKQPVGHAAEFVVAGVGGARTSFPFRVEVA